MLGGKALVSLIRFTTPQSAAQTPSTRGSGFAALLERIAGNGVRLILVETANRFARDLIVQETGWRYRQKLGVELVAVDSPSAFLDDTPTDVLIRQVLGASRNLKRPLSSPNWLPRAGTGRMGGKKRSLTATRPEVAARATELRRASPEMTLRAINAQLALEGFLTPSGKAYGPSAIQRILERI
jgi:hypothetical protein